MNSLDMVDVEDNPDLETSHTNVLPSLKLLNHFIVLRLAHTVLPVCFVKQLLCLSKLSTKFAAHIVLYAPSLSMCH